MLGNMIVLNSLVITTYRQMGTVWAATFLLYGESVKVTCRVMLYSVFKPKLVRETVSLFPVQQIVWFINNSNSAVLIWSCDAV